MTVLSGGNVKRRECGQDCQEIGPLGIAIHELYSGHITAFSTINEAMPVEKYGVKASRLD